MSKVALITGITGQDGAYLSKSLLEKGYKVHGIVRRSSTPNTMKLHRVGLDEAINSGRIELHYGDLTDAANLSYLIKETQPDEIYNLGAQSHVKVSFDNPIYTANTDGLGTLHLLEAIRLHGLTEKTKFYQASTSELYGEVKETPQKETTPFHPRSPYGVAKLYGYWITVNYRESYGIYACNGILFNHESPLRGLNFVTRKITHGAVKIAKGQQDKIELGNLDARRDWGHAEDYVEAMHLMLQQEKAEDYVVATGKTTTVRDFVKMSFNELGIELEFTGSGENEKGIVTSCSNPEFQIETGKTIVGVNPKFYRPAEVELLLGDPSKAKNNLGWTPQHNLQSLVSDMIRGEIEYVETGQLDVGTD